MDLMKHIVPLAPLLIALTLAAPVAAQDGTQDNTQNNTMSDFKKRFGKLSDNAQTLLEGWKDEIGPKLDEIGPALGDMIDRLGDMSAFHAPEVLENGDILIRRKQPLPPEPAPVPERTPEPEAIQPDKPIIDL